MTDLIKAAGHADTETTKNIYTAVVDNIPQEEFERAQNPTRTFDNIPAEELKGVKNNG